MPLMSITNTSTLEAKMVALGIIGTRRVCGVTSSDAVPCTVCMRMTATYKLRIRGDKSIIYLCVDCNAISKDPRVSIFTYKTSIYLYMSIIAFNYRQMINMLAEICALGGETIVGVSKRLCTSCFACPNDAIATIRCGCDTVYVCNNCRIMINAMRPFMAKRLALIYNALSATMWCKDVLSLLCQNVIVVGVSM